MEIPPVYTEISENNIINIIVVREDLETRVHWPSSSGQWGSQ